MYCTAGDQAGPDICSNIVLLDGSIISAKKIVNLTADASRMQTVLDQYVYWLVGLLKAFEIQGQTALPLFAESSTWYLMPGPP